MNPPPGRRRKDLDRERERRAQLLDAARTLFFEHGYRGTTMQQIASAAGYSKRTVYLDYLNKDELFISVCAEGLELLLRSLELIPVDELDTQACIERFPDALISFSRDHAPYFRMIFSEATPAIIGACSEPLRQRVAALERACLGTVVKLVERAVREGQVRPVDPWETAGVFVGTSTGIILLTLGGSQTMFTRERLESLSRQAVQTLWRGVRAREPDTP